MYELCIRADNMFVKVYEQNGFGNDRAWEIHVGRSTKWSLELGVLKDN